MAENSAIEWTHHTFNPWIGCTKVSPACDHCYAERERAVTCLGVTWGAGQPRHRTSVDNWRKPLAWNRKAAKEGVRYRVFCASLADVFDAEVPDEWRDELFALIAVTPHLDWLLLTKRPKVARSYLATKNRDEAIGHRAFELIETMGWCSPEQSAIAAGLLHGGGPHVPSANARLADHAHAWPLPNVWLGTTVENQKMAELRIPHLLATPAAVRFLSMEPLLGPVDLTAISRPYDDTQIPYDTLDGRWHEVDGFNAGYGIERINWVIVGGESGPSARPMHPEWAQSLRYQCAGAGVPFFFKQWGEWGLYAPRDKDGRLMMADGYALANDGTLYRMTDLAYPDGPRRGEALRAGHDRANLHTVYRVGKRASGRDLDGRTHDEFPEISDAA